jgi:hypothetical protein
MKDKNYYHRFASQLLRALLITGTGSAVTLLLHLHVDFSPQLTAYSVELDRLDILAAATQPEFSGLRTFIKRVVEERIEKERQTPSKQEAMMDRVRGKSLPADL